MPSPKPSPRPARSPSSKPTGSPAIRSATSPATKAAAMPSGKSPQNRSSLTRGRKPETGSDVRPRTGPGSGRRSKPPTNPPKGPSPAHSADRAAVWTLPSPMPEAIQPTEEFLAFAESAGIVFEDGDVERLGTYLALLLDANQAVNLTAIKEPSEAWTRHLADSLTLIPTLADLEPGSKVIDVGSGGGLPGIPLAITMPDLHFTLLEATGKKADFLKLVVAGLNLKNVTVLNDRAERAAHDRGEKKPDPKSPGASVRVGGHREFYDAAVARAVGRLPIIAELTVPFVRIGGRTLLVKGQQAEAELAEGTGALKRLNAVYVTTVETPTGRIIVLEKGSATPRDYPRRDGEPARSPLK